MSIPELMSTPAGRGGRIAAGVALILVGLLAVGGTGGVVIAVIGVVPILAGVFDVCLIAPLLRR